MKKQKILSRFNINVKDYNIELEEILDKKTFSEEAQNLLLSIFYKIENFYSDYKLDKREGPTRDEFIESLIKIIFKYCNKIEVMKPKSSKNQKKYFVNLEEGSLKTFPSEDVLLYALYKTNQLEKLEGKAFLDNAVIEVLNEGRALNNSEVIRDFNGWSWTSMIDNINSLQYNLIYQNLLILLGYKELTRITNLEDKRKIKTEICNKLQEEYGEAAKAFLNKFFSACIFIKSTKDDEFKEQVIIENEKIDKKLNMLENKEDFLNRITKDKKELTDKIKEIDQKLNDVDLLKEEYDKRNEALPKEKKIFSISNLVDILEAERNDLLQEIKEYNDLMDPKKFIEMKKQLEENKSFFDNLNIREDKKEPISQCILELQKEFLNCFEIKIDKCDLKKNMIDLIYEYRYYRFLKYKKDRTIRGDRRLNKQNEIIISSIIKKAEELKVLEKVSSKKEYNKSILEEIFNTKMITLENVHIVLSQEDEKIIVKYYDGNVLETKKDFSIKENDIKLRKKIKLFV